MQWRFASGHWSYAHADTIAIAFTDAKRLTYAIANANAFAEPIANAEAITDADTDTDTKTVTNADANSNANSNSDTDTIGAHGYSLVDCEHQFGIGRLQRISRRDQRRTLRARFKYVVSIGTEFRRYQSRRGTDVFLRCHRRGILGSGKRGLERGFSKRSDAVTNGLS